MGRTKAVGGGGGEEEERWATEVTLGSQNRLECRRVNRCKTGEPVPTVTGSLERLGPQINFVFSGVFFTNHS